MIAYCRKIRIEVGCQWLSPDPLTFYNTSHPCTVAGCWLWASPSNKQVEVSRRSMQTLNQCCEWDFGKFYSVPIWPPGKLLNFSKQSPLKALLLTVQSRRSLMYLVMLRDNVTFQHVFNWFSSSPPTRSHLANPLSSNGFIDSGLKVQWALLFLPQQTVLTTHSLHHAPIPPMYNLLPL